MRLQSEDIIRASVRSYNLELLPPTSQLTYLVTDAETPRRGSKAIWISAALSGKVIVVTLVLQRIRQP